MFYKANLRDLEEVQKKDASWEPNSGSGSRFNGYKKLMLEVSSKSGADGAREAAVLGIMQKVLEIPKAIILCCYCLYQTLYSLFECACRCLMHA